MLPDYERNKLAAMTVVDGVNDSIPSNRSAVYLCAYTALWAVALLSLRRWQHFEAGEALIAFVVLAVILPALGMLSTRSTVPLRHAVRRPGVETAALMLYLVGITWVLVYGFGYFVRVAVEPRHSILVLAVKLLIFVFIPRAMVWVLGGYKFGDQTLIALGWSTIRPALWMSIAVLVMQLFLGNGLHSIKEAHLPAWVIAVATPLSFVWLMLEVGLVEEFFFRVLLQERLATVLRSPWAGLVVAAVLFGLAHAPGFYLRSASTQEGLGPHPSLLMAVGYSIVMTSLAGLFLGVLWIRTKNLAVLMIVHAATDFLPNLTDWVKTFHLFTS
jgi:uncharacterized protein